MSKNKGKLKVFSFLLISGLFAFITFQGYQFYNQYVQENKILKKIIERLTAESRIAEVLVTEVQYNSILNEHLTTIKFLEYDTQGRPLKPKYFTFSGNIIQFQSLVIRFDDALVEGGDALKGKSASLFWKVFMLDGTKTQEYTVTEANQIPAGYKIDGLEIPYEEHFWKEFWAYALDPQFAKKRGIKNAQIEAPGTKFVPGLLYTLKIEHDGGIRIDVSEIPAILKGETIAQ